ncbi:uncharacterized protein LOC118145665 isoform X1 [Callithrix jacchus]
MQVPEEAKTDCEKPWELRRKEPLQSRDRKLVGKARSQAVRFLLDYLYPGHDLLVVLWMPIPIVFLGVSTVGLFVRKIIFRLCARALERETAKRKSAYKQHRRRKQGVPERHMSEEPAQKRLCLKNTFWRADSGPHSVPVRNSSCIPTENTEMTKVNMAAAQRHHYSALPCSPYLMAEPSRPLMACQPPPPSGCHLGAQPFPSVDYFWGPQITTQEHLLLPLPPSANDFLSPYTTPPECLLTPLPPSTHDEFSRPQTPTEECLLLPLLPLANDFLSPYTTPPECLLTPLPPSTHDEFSRPQTPTEECLLLTSTALSQ